MLCLNIEQLVRTLVENFIINLVASQSREIMHLVASVCPIKIWQHIEAFHTDSAQGSAQKILSRACEPSVWTRFSLDFQRRLGISDRSCMMFTPVVRLGLGLESANALIGKKVGSHYFFYFASWLHIFGTGRPTPERAEVHLRCALRRHFLQPKVYS